jgi:CRP-like cAMP-binding protein
VAPSSSASDSESQAVKLAREAEALAASPGDTAALARVAAAVEDLGNRSLAAKAFEALAVSAREDGQFALAAFAAVALAHLGDAAGGKKANAALAAAFAQGSKRVDNKRRTRPPAPPPPKASSQEPAGAAPDTNAAMKAASAAIDAAAAYAADLAKRAGPLPQVPLVASLDAASLTELLGAMEPVSKKVGEVVVDVGEDARSLYLVARGALAVSRGTQELGRLAAGAFFGEIALLSGASRTARVTVVDDAWLLEIPHQGLEAAAAQAPALADTLARHARARLLANTMRTSEIFSRLTPAEREQLMPRFQVHVLAPGDKALTAGQEGDRLHVIVSGDVDVSLGERQLAALGAGDVFGEMSLLGRRPASADVVARTRTVTLSLDRVGFDDIAVKRPELLGEVYKLLVAREAENRQAEVAHEVQPEDIVV